MKCYCYENESEFVFCVENADDKLGKIIEAAWYDKVGNKYFKKYPNTINDKKLLINNFSRLGESMFSGNGDWKKALSKFAEKCYEQNIDWYITGSVSESVMGVDISPHDIDIVSHVKDFFKIKDIFSDYLIEPFVDNGGTWIVRYFGRLCIDGVMIDIVADDNRNEENHPYESVQWNGYIVKAEPIQERYKIEIQRNRKDRIKAFEEYFKKEIKKPVPGTNSLCNN